MSDFAPYADDTTALTVGGLTIENGLTRISISGSLDIPRDGTGLAHVRALKAAVDAMHRALRDEPRQAGTMTETTTKRSTRKNPFA